jgi:hypothetical protein
MAERWTDPFAGGQLPSAFPEVAPYPTLKRLLTEQVDMQFADLRVLLRLPQNDIAPHVGCNFTAAAAIANQISGFSIWLFHTRYAQQLRRCEKKRRDPLSGKRFHGFVRAYYPRLSGEPTHDTIAKKLYQARNLLSHNLGISDVGRKPRRQEILIGKPDPPMSAEDIVDLELEAQYPGTGVPVRREGTRIRLSVPGLYWALGRMLRAAVVEHPARCEQEAERLVGALPLPRTESLTAWG